MIQKQNPAVIDFDDSMYHWYALDIEQAFDSFEDKLSGKALEIAKNEFIRGYKKSAAIPKR
ncbi:MAG: hypothetical protein ACLSAP_02310 [Oscillospiraceae bacterium]